MARNRIKAVLAERGMSAKALADCVEDCNPAIVSYIANGKALPTPECLKEMCSRLGCSPADLYDATDVDLPSLFSDEAAASRRIRSLASGSLPRKPPRSVRPSSPLAIQASASGCERCGATPWCVTWSTWKVPRSIYLRLF